MISNKRKTILLVLLMVFIITLAQTLMKKGINSLELSGLSDILTSYGLTQILTQPYILIGIVLYGLSVVVWLGAISRTDISLAYPLLSLSYIFLTISAIIFLNEHVSFTRWMGVILIFIGTIYIGKS